MIITIFNFNRIYIMKQNKIKYLLLIFSYFVRKRQERLGMSTALRIRNCVRVFLSAINSQLSDFTKFTSRNVNSTFDLPYIKGARGLTFMCIFTETVMVKPMIIILALFLKCECHGAQYEHYPMPYNAAMPVDNSLIFSKSKSCQH